MGSGADRRSADARCGLLLDLFDRAEVRDAAAAWTARVNTVTARTDRVDVDALLIRSDCCVACALPTGQDLDATTLVRALGTWFGQTGLSAALTVVSDSLGMSRRPISDVTRM